MIQQQDTYPIADETLEAMLAGEQPGLVRFCMRLTGNAEFAEDLAQETLIEAWRNYHKFNYGEQSSSWKKWLTGIARNVCKRWARSYYHDRSHLTLVAQYNDDGAETSLEELSLDDYDIELELERDELARLLDRALALLPPSVRDVLIERYIHESSHAEISERLGVSEDALVQRLHRGKLALRRVITTQMRDEAATYGIIISDTEALQQETRIWCPLCGKGQLIRFYDPDGKGVGFTCPNCWHIASLPHSVSTVWKGINSPKPMLSRLLDYLGSHYWQAINTQQTNCWQCGHKAQKNRILDPEEFPVEYSIPPYRSASIQCSRCGHQDLNGLPHLSLDTCEARQFWRKHPRMQWLPPHEIEHAGQLALISSFRSINDSARLDIFLQKTTLKVLAIHESAQ